MYYEWHTLVLSPVEGDLTASNTVSCIDHKKGASSGISSQPIKRDKIVDVFYVISFRHSPSLDESSLPEPEAVNVYRMQHTKDVYHRYLEGVPLCVYEIALYNFHKQGNLLQTDLDRWLFAVMDETLSNIRHPERFEMYKTITNLWL
jgi:hypothetical protein